MVTKDAIFEKHWPLPRSIDLVEAPFELAYEAVRNQITHFVGNEPIEHGWQEVGSMGEVFESVDYFTSVPTIYYIIPTKTPWTAIWNNSFEFDGHSELCWNLTALHTLTTIAWASSDTADVFQAGSHFTHRSKPENGVVIRSLHCSVQDGRWHSYQQGEPIPEEDQSLLAADELRLNEEAMMSFLERLGARPWREDFYDFSEGRIYRVERTQPPASVFKRGPGEIRFGG